MDRIFAYSVLALLALSPGLASAETAPLTVARPAGEIDLAGIAAGAVGVLYRFRQALEQTVAGEEDSRRALETRLRDAAERYQRAIARAQQARPLVARGADPRIVAAWQATRKELRTIEDIKDRMRSLALRLESSRSDARALAAWTAAARILPETRSERGSVDDVARRAERLGKECERAEAALEAAVRRWNADLLATRARVEMLSAAVGAGLPPGVVLPESVI
jgi:hypothetical protein